jgi:hypothetical protein
MNEMHELGGNFQGYCHDMPLCEQHHHNNRYHLGVWGGGQRYHAFYCLTMSDLLI